LSGIGGGFFGFSRKLMIVLSASIRTTPKPFAFSRGASRHPTVTSAPESTWCCNTFSKSIL